jgi:hypothetical protein
MLHGIASHAAPATLDRLAKEIPADHRAELDAIAAAAGLDADRLVHANLVLDCGCSAALRLGDAEGKRPLMLGRDLDFANATLLGQETVVEDIHPTGKHAFVAVGWPGFAGVVSGMNDAGMVAVILLNLTPGTASDAGGCPLGFQVRALLEDCATCDQAIAAFGKTPVASANFVMVADPGHAAVLWQDHGTAHQVAPKDGWLFCTNAAMDADHAGPDDARGNCFRALVTADADPGWLRGALCATYLTALNAQAMVFIPATRHLHLATGTSSHPAALQRWHDIDCGPLLDGRSITAAAVVDLGVVADPPKHFGQNR